MAKASTLGEEPSSAERLNVELFGRPQTPRREQLACAGDAQIRKTELIASKVCVEAPTIYVNAIEPMALAIDNRTEELPTKLGMNDGCHSCTVACTGYRRAGTGRRRIASERTSKLRSQVSELRHGHTRNYGLHENTSVATHILRLAKSEACEEAGRQTHYRHQDGHRPLVFDVLVVEGEDQALRRKQRTTN